MLEARCRDRRSIPEGVCFNQNSIGSPKVRGFLPFECKAAATERPYGPAPIIAIWQLELDISASAIPFEGATGKEQVRSSGS